MRSYLIEELAPEDIEKFKEYCERENLPGPIEDIYWLIIPEEQLTQEQQEHLSGCGPYFFSLETGEDWLKLELLARCRERIRCSCIRYATEEQRFEVINRLDTMLKNLDIPA